MAETPDIDPASLCQQYSAPQHSAPQCDIDPDSYGDWVSVSVDEESEDDAGILFRGAVEAPAPVEAAPLQASMLTRIASELRSIKTELSDLRDHFAEQREPALFSAAAADIAMQDGAIAQRRIGQALAACSAAQNVAQNANVAEATAEGSAAQNVAQNAAAQPSREELRTLFAYLDRLLESLPEETIEEFAKSEYFELYRKIFNLLDLA